MNKAKSIVISALACLLLLAGVPSWAVVQPAVAAAGGPQSEAVAAPEQPDSGARGNDGVRISLITCGPGADVWSYYGHTALRIENPATGMDVVANWGMFSFEQPFFVARFVFGRTDYSMAVWPTSRFLDIYRREGRWVYEQTLALTPQEKADVMAAVGRNAAEPGWTYRYNFFTDNCTTRARQAVTDHLKCRLSFEPSYLVTDSLAAFPTWRGLIHIYNAHHRWARFGNDLLLGLEADRPTTRLEQQFLPMRLMTDIGMALLVRSETSGRRGGGSVGYYEPLAVEETVLVGDEGQMRATLAAHESDTPLTPTVVLGLVCAIVAVATLIERERMLNLWLLDAALLAVTGLAGVVLGLMVFSAHPAVSINLQILLLNPLWLIALVAVAKGGRRGRHTRWWAVIALFTLLFLAGSAWQTYAEGMYFVALSLLFRVTSHYRGGIPCALVGPTRPDEACSTKN